MRLQRLFTHKHFKCVETPPPLVEYIVFWVGCLIGASPQMTKNLINFDEMEIILFYLKIYNLYKK